MAPATCMLRVCTYACTVIDMSFSCCMGFCFSIQAIIGKHLLPNHLLARVDRLDEMVLDCACTSRCGSLGLLQDTDLNMSALNMPRATTTSGITTT